MDGKDALASREVRRPEPFEVELIAIMIKLTLMELFVLIKDKVQRIHFLKFINNLTLSAFISSLITIVNCLLIFRASHKSGATGQVEKRKLL